MRTTARTPGRAGVPSAHACTLLDNNLVQNAIRSSAIVKKNWRFIGPADAGQRAATISSFIVSCQRHGKDPVAYLRDVMRRLPTLTAKNELAPTKLAAWQSVYF